MLVNNKLWQVRAGAIETFKINRFQKSSRHYVHLCIKNIKDTEV